jgi:hypothetical protein
MRSFSLLLLAHADKAILAGFGLWVGVSGLGWFLHPAPLDRTAELEGALAQVRGYMEAPADPGTLPAPLPDLTADLRQELDPEAVPAGAGMPGWTLHRRPQFLFSVEPGLPPLEHRHEPARVASVDASTRGEVRLVLEGGACSDWLIPSAELWRCVDGGPWAKVADLGDDDGEGYVDRDVRPEQSLEYRVRSRVRLDLDHPRVAQRELTDADLPAEVRDRTSAASASVVTPAELGLSVAAVVAGDPVRGRKGQAQITVHRWDAEARRFRRKPFLVREGEPIGAGSFATPWTLERVGVERRPIDGRPGYTRPVGWIEFGQGESTRRLDDRTPFRAAPAETR